MDSEENELKYTEQEINCLDLILPQVQIKEYNELDYIEETSDSQEDDDEDYDEDEFKEQEEISSQNNFVLQDVQEAPPKLALEKKSKNDSEIKPGKRKSKNNSKRKFQNDTERKPGKRKSKRLAIKLNNLNNKDGESHPESSPELEIASQAEYSPRIKRQKRQPNDMLSCNRPNCMFQCHGLKDMNAHKYAAHYGKKEYKCDQCDYVGAQPINLRRHYVKHTGVNLYQCEFEGCSFSCKHSSSYDYHKNKYHPKGPPLTCSEVGCNFKTHQPVQLKRHKLLEHKTDKTKKCNECGYTCYSTNEIRYHIKLHSEVVYYYCDFPDCGFAAKSTTGLVRHTAQHKSNKKFSCNECEFRTNFKASIINHQKMHTGRDSKPFNCKFCRKCYLNDHSLEKHMIKKHPSLAQVAKKNPDLKLLECQ